MSIDCTFTVPMEPKPKGRPRVSVRAGKPHGYTPAATRKWEADFSTIAAAHMPRDVVDEPVRVDLLFVLPRPKRLMRKMDPDGLIWAPARPDRDNLEKAVLDAMKTCWRDDSLVVCGETLKCYAERTGRARVVCRVRSADADPWFKAFSLGLAK
jgi:Holliday junction resolvase RusA-like endonuclease